MDLELDAEQLALVDAIRTVLDREWPPAALRRLVEDGAGAEALWSRMVELDWAALCIPEADGGMGYGPVEAALVMEGGGAVVAGGPLLPTVGLFVPLVRELGTGAQCRQLLGAVADGTRTGTAAIGELTQEAFGADLDVGAATVRARPGGGTWRLEGVARSVMEAAHADHVIVPAGLDAGGIGVFVVAVGDLDCTPVRSVDGSRRLATVRLDGAMPVADGVLGDPGASATTGGVRRALEESVAMAAAELVGTCGTIFRTTLGHVKDREQFGVPIGSFQAVKHRLADAYLALEAARAAVLVAAAALAEDDPRRSVAVSTAKALAGDCADLVSREGIQLLGGTGFTWEHDMHLYVKRALASKSLLGTAEVHRQRVADLIGLVPAAR